MMQSAANHQSEDIQGKNSTKIGYTKKIDDALVYAAVHHRHHVRKGTLVPYIIHPAHIALVLTRYECDSDTIVAGVLHDVVEDCDEHSRDEHCEDIRTKFGERVLADVITVSKPKMDSEGRKLSGAEKKKAYLSQLKAGSRSAMWICAADKLHNSQCLINDLHQSSGAQGNVWNRFNDSPAEIIRWYQSVLEALRELRFDEAMLSELSAAVTTLETVAAPFVAALPLPQH